MKLLQIVPSYKPAYIYGGPIHSVSALCESLVNQGHDTTVITTTANGEAELDVTTGEIHLIDGVKVIYFPRITKDHTHFSPQLFKYLYNNIKQYDTVHIHSWWNLVSIFALLICKLKRVTPVVSPRGMLSTYIKETRHNFMKNVIHYTIGIPFLSKVKFHATSAAEANEIKRIFSEANVTEIYNFVKTPDAPPFTTMEDSRPLNLLFLSRVDPKKGLELILKALEKVSWSFVLNVAGGGDEGYIKELQNLATQLHLQDRVRWLGPVYGDKKFEVLASHDVLVLTSYNENFANVLIESLAVGTPVMISREVGLSSYIEAQDLGWVCGLAVDEILAALNSINTNREKLTNIRKRAPMLIKKDFDHGVLVKQYVELYKGKR